MKNYNEMHGFIRDTTNAQVPLWKMPFGIFALRAEISLWIYNERRFLKRGSCRICCVANKTVNFVVILHV